MNTIKSNHCVDIYIAIKKKYIEYKILAVTDFRVFDDTNIIWDTEEYVPNLYDSDVEDYVCERIEELEEIGFNLFKLVLRNIFTNEYIYPVFNSNEWNK